MKDKPTTYTDAVGSYYTDGNGNRMYDNGGGPWLMSAPLTFESSGVEGADCEPRYNGLVSRTDQYAWEIVRRPDGVFSFDDLNIDAHLYLKGGETVNIVDNRVANPPTISAYIVRDRAGEQYGQHTMVAKPNPKYDMESGNGDLPDEKGEPRYLPLDLTAILGGEK